MNILSSLLFIAIVSCTKAGSADPINTGGNGSGTPPSVDTIPSLATVQGWLVDKRVTEQTAALFYNLKKVAKTNILFGHQDDTKRGYGWANEEGQPYQPTKSDVKDVTGAYPAVYGWDFNFVAGTGTGAWFNYENSKLHDLVVDAYNRGGINTFCWHYQNPATGGSFYWSSSPVEAVSKIIPGGSLNATYKNDLKKVADFAKSLVGADGNVIPIIFRPFHEFDGDWFWWGRAHSTVSDFKALYQYTVTYLRDSLNVHNFLYAWSPDRNYNDLTTLMERYPGDEFVDILGSDNYEDLKPAVNIAIASNKLKILSDYAKNKNKVAALTETGLANVTQQDWFTNKLLQVLILQKLELAYALVWANRTDTYWTPYPGHASATDFISFKNHTYVKFDDEIQGMYLLK
jgi:mannan endo-1,4-beta-mannosidase